MTRHRGHDPDAYGVDQDLSPTALAVRAVLEREGPLTWAEIAKTAEFSPRGTEWALSQLRDAGEVTTRPCLRDPRKRVYEVNDD